MEDVEFAVVDLETTGGNFTEDRIIEIAIVAFSPNQGILETFTSLVNPQKEIPFMIQKLTGIQPKDLVEAPTFDKIAEEVQKFTQNRIFVAHNVSFDYHFLKQEFGRLSQTFLRKKICTFKMAKTLVSGVPSYGLDKICSYFNIPIVQRHRALGDAMAATELFKRLLEIDNHRFLENILSDGLSDAMIPKKLSRKDLNNLPEERGIYSFYDTGGNPLYIGRGKDIRSSIIQHFQQNFKTWKNKIAHIHAYSTGSEIIALLKELIEIQKYAPPYNQGPHNPFPDFVLKKKKNQEGYLELLLAPLENLNSHYILRFSSQKEGIGHLKSWVNRFGLCPHLCGLGSEKPCKNYALKKCGGPCIGRESPSSYNQKVKQALISLTLPYSNFLLYDSGRHIGEESVIWVGNGQIKGFGYLPKRRENKENTIESLQDLKTRISPMPIYIPPSNYLFLLLKYSKKKKTKIRILDF